ncbi:hypothetical protein ES705_29869 [subsurface metagenome]
MKVWSADYVVVYQQHDTKLDKKWSHAGFRALSHFSWAKYEKELGQTKPYYGPTPDWWLLEQSA